jgi:demethylmenaquinone methyltransferase/2-methoxy-6-polyprenyl-1,4-benzoquinol methylase
MPATDPARDVWNDTLLQNPHEVADKRTRVQKMFAAIAPSYDLNNRLHSLWMDQAWRRKAVKLANVQPTDTIIDVACGTGDLAIEFEKKLWWKHSLEHIWGKSAVIGIDFTFEMLPLARRKAMSIFAPVLSNPRPTFIGDRMRWINADALALPLADQSANILSIAFGIRNVADPAAALREFSRILKPGGRLIILEFSLPTNRILRALYNFYFTKILPRTATWISRDKTGAYKYLPQSVNTFISRDSMQQMMRTAGFTDVQALPLTFGICVCYLGYKR